MKVQSKVFLLRSLSMVFVLQAAVNGQAQFAAGLGAGLTINFPSHAPDQPYTNFQPAPGASVTVPVQYQYARHWALRTEPAFIQKNRHLQRTGDFSGTYEKRFNTYLQLPVMLQYRTWQYRNFSAYAQAGVFAGYWLSSRVKGALPDIYGLIDSVRDNGQVDSYFRIKEYDEKYKFNAEKDQRLDMGAIAGIGISYHYTERHQLSLECRYAQSFISYEKQYMSNQQRPRHQTLSVMLLWMVKMGNW